MMLQDLLSGQHAADQIASAAAGTEDLQTQEQLASEVSPIASTDAQGTAQQLCSSMAPQLRMDVFDLPATDSDSEISATSLQVSGLSQGGSKAARPASFRQPPAPSTSPQSQLPAGMQQPQPMEAPEHLRDTPDGDEAPAAAAAAAAAVSTSMDAAQSAALPAQSSAGNSFFVVASSSSEVTIRQQQEVRMLWSTCERVAQEQRLRLSQEGLDPLSHRSLASTSGRPALAC